MRKYHILFSLNIYCLTKILLPTKYIKEKLSLNREKLENKLDKLNGYEQCSRRIGLDRPKAQLAWMSIPMVGMMGLHDMPIYHKVG